MKFLVIVFILIMVSVALTMVDINVLKKLIRAILAMFDSKIPCIIMNLFSTSEKHIEKSILGSEKDDSAVPTSYLISAVLYHISPSGRHIEKWPISSDHEYLIGRSQTTDIKVTERLGQHLISREHASISAGHDAFSVNDRNSKNGLYDKNHCRAFSVTVGFEEPFYLAEEKFIFRTK